MNERGLFLDLNRVARGRPFGVHWHHYHTYEVLRTDRMHTVCMTLESLGYLEKRIPHSDPRLFSAWSFTEAGVELLDELTWHWSIA